MLFKQRPKLGIYRLLETVNHIIGIMINNKVSNIPVNYIWFTNKKPASLADNPVHECRISQMFGHYTPAHPGCVFPNTGQMNLFVRYNREGIYPAKAKITYFCSSANSTL
jgi:hypothetical protein